MSADTAEGREAEKKEALDAMNDLTNHPRFTADRRLACPARSWDVPGHVCQCVIRRPLCDGENHLCMCGSGWWTHGCDCSTPREKENMATPVSITLNATQGEFQVEVSIHAEVTVNPGSVAAVQLERATKAMAILLNSQEGDDDPDF